MILIKKVLVTGATGFTGSFVVRELCAAGYEVYCFVRESSNTSVLSGCEVTYVTGDLGQPSSLFEALKGMDALVNVASIGFGHGPDTVRACEDAGVKRALFFSTTAVFTTLEAKSKETRLKAENAITGSGLEYTIFRPTMIYGTPRDRNMIKLIRFVDRFPVVPIFGSGTSVQQPVYVRDLARAVATVLNLSQTFRKDYNVSGKEPITYNEVVDTVAALLGKRVVKIHLPVRLSLAAVNLARAIPGLPNFTAEQVLRLNEDKAFSHEAAADDFRYAPVSFREGIAAEIEEYQMLKKGDEAS
ncbi:MAG: NAD-dependent epimerase/dehydratase family protein [Desulforudis sp.]|nr:MAG: NAD-dependent epimerase/dehydratase family protein [Desulforudis sp.]